jgi:deazaflavin-dependent oxidoreductase (nitroreductase family)
MGHDHVARYLETRGTVGHEWNGVRCLILFTTGRITGAMRAVPLIYGQDGDALVVVASRGGAPKHPAWYTNLTAHPTVEVQVGADRFRALTRTVKGRERARLWRLMADIWPRYDSYQSRTEREIPVMVIERQRQLPG